MARVHFLAVLTVYFGYTRFTFVGPATPGIYTTFALPACWFIFAYGCRCAQYIYAAFCYLHIPPFTCLPLHTCCIHFVHHHFATVIISRSPLMGSGLPGRRGIGSGYLVTCTATATPPHVPTTCVTYRTVFRHRLPAAAFTFLTPACKTSYSPASRAYNGDSNLFYHLFPSFTHFTCTLFLSTTGTAPANDTCGTLPAFCVTYTPQRAVSISSLYHLYLLFRRFAAILCRIVAANTA